MQEGNGNTAERQPLTLQLAKESQLMISKLRELKLDDPSAFGMRVFGENGSQIAILLGKIHAPETPGEQAQTATEEKYLVISPKGFFLAGGKSQILPDPDHLGSILKKGISQNGQVSIDEKEGYLKINTDANNFHSFYIKRLDCTPEQFAEILKLAVESSQKVAQKPLQDEIARAVVGNTVLDTMIKQGQSIPTPPPFGGSGPAA